jgi:hypothetical protein
VTALNQNTAQGTMIGGASGTGLGGTLLLIEQSANLISLALVGIGALVAICGLMLNWHFMRLRNEREVAEALRKKQAFDKTMGLEDERINNGEAERIKGVDHGQ